MKPSILVAYPSLGSFLTGLSILPISSWVLDSGAFSAYTSGTKIDLSKYISDCLSVMGSAFPPECIFALDVIGDHEATMRNTERMRVAGVPAIPSFHRGSSFHYLEDMARHYDKIALGGLAIRGRGGHGTRLQITDKTKYLDQCFARLWPKWVHGFGAADKRLLDRFPFASVDSTTWQYAPSRYGYSSQFGSRRAAAVRGNRELLAVFIRSELEWFLSLQKRHRERYGRIMAVVGLPGLTMRFSGSMSAFRWLLHPKMATL
jgi:hypothetical protein